MIFLLFLLSATVFAINANFQLFPFTSPPNPDISVHEAIRVLEEVVKEEKVVEQFCYKHYCDIKEDKVGTSTTEKPSITEVGTSTTEKSSTTEQILGSFSCADLYNSGHTVSGVYTIDLKKYLISGLKTASVYCDMTLDGGGWTVIQRRYVGHDENFNRNWKDYVNGFGDIKRSMWLGNEIIHILTTQENVTLNVFIVDFSYNTFKANYGKFQIADEKDGYRLHVGNYSGDAGDSLASHNGMKFSTYDRDDVNRCASKSKGGWWFNSDGCVYSHLNGKANKEGKDSHGLGLAWSTHNVKGALMKIRPVNFKKGSTG